ncbi:MAG: DUF547 domain-containing protein [Planctomycetota bacterium]|jgi:hypothetical protein
MMSRARGTGTVVLVIVAGLVAAFAVGLAPMAGHRAAHITLMTATQKRGFSYVDYMAVLKEFVDEDGMVDYKGLKANRGRLDAFVRSLGSVRRDEFEKWSDEQQVAFWINAYNGLTLQVIIDNYPIEPSFFASLRFPDNSIRQIPGVWDKIEFRVMGRKMTLEDIEHGTLRKGFNEPRIHMALVCAAMGCPPLLNEPYEADRLDEQFSRRAQRFLRNAKKFRIDRRKNEVYLSPIFDWFGKDFIRTYGTDRQFKRHGKAERAVLSYVSQHLEDRDRRYLETAAYAIEYLDYDWSLNEQKAEKTR